MDCRELGLSLLIILVCLVSFASSSPKQKTLPSEFMQKVKLKDKVIYGSKVEGGSHHPSGGRAHGNGENGGSRSPNTQGGSAVIPVIIGGTAAANNNRHRVGNHHGAANCNLDEISFLTSLVITLVSSLVELLLLV